MNQIYTKEDYDEMRISATQIQSSAEPKSNQGDNVILLTYLYLVDLVSTQQQSAALKAKQLQSNADAQQAVNRQVENVHWYNEPDKQYSPLVHHGANPFSSWAAFAAWFCGAKAVSYDTGGQLLNGVDINIAQIKNQQEDATRQQLQNTLATLQQTGQVGDSRVNTDCELSVRTMQQCSALLDMTKTLTEKILHTRS